MKRFSEKALSSIFFVLTITGVILLWSLFARLINSEYILPTVIQTVKAFPNLIKGGLFSALLGTLFRSFIAFLISFILALVLAILSSKSKIGRYIINPLSAITRALPTIAIVLLLLFWTTSKIAPMVVTTIVVFPTVYTGILNALNSFDKDLYSVSKVYNIPRKQMLFKVYLPQIMPDMLILIGANLSLNIKLMVAAEVLSQTANSVGFMLNSAKAYFEISSMLAIVVLTVAIGLCLELVFSGIARKVGKWK